jgi:hypothetical protein
MRTILIALLFVSCGKSPDNFKRCYTRAEATNYCIGTRIAQTGETSQLAAIYCSPRYPAEGCYTLGGL